MVVTVLRGFVMVVVLFNSLKSKLFIIYEVHLVDYTWLTSARIGNIGEISKETLNIL